MIHHVGLEVHADALEAEVAFWTLLGWHEVIVADGIGGTGRWMQHGAQQIHFLVPEGGATVPNQAHPALVDDDLDATVTRLASAGFETLERTRHWGARRVFTRSPSGHRVELMSAPPEGDRPVPPTRATNA